MLTIAVIGLLAAEVPLPYTVGGVGGIGALAIYLLRELRHASDGTWKIVREKNKIIHRQNYDLAYKDWRIADLENDLLRCRGLLNDNNVSHVEQPGPYIPPTEAELKTW